ncbi:MAG: dihydropteroate synthase [Bdellovibrionales bacterium]|nr:dihydropteroate synthase [Bdellovibrionales bacterium]
MAVVLVGILNITPDSFSDGGSFLDPEIACRHAFQLVEDGAEYVDIGADSTRPGSRCVGVEEEWRRLEPVLRILQAKLPLSIDTHHSEIARRAIDYGVSIINDVSAGQDTAMFEVVKKAALRIVLMHSRYSSPHDFEVCSQQTPAQNIVEEVCDSLQIKLDKACNAGISPDQVILDSGFGAFISSDPRDSDRLVQNYDVLQRFNCDLMLGISRKGFLGAAGAKTLPERDVLSARYAAQILEALRAEQVLYVRAHNVAIHREML